jgi:hypothetical protein
MDPLYPEIPEDLAALTDDELAALLGQLESAADAVFDGSADVGDRTQTQVVEETAAAVTAIEAIRGEQDARAEQAAADAQALADLQTRVRPVEEPEPDEPAEPAQEPSPDPAAAVEPEPVAAAAQPAARRAASVPAARRAPAAQPVEKKGPQASLVASAEMPGMKLGQEISRLELAEAMMRKHRSFGAPLNIPAGVEMEKHTIATMTTDWSSMPERILGNDPAENWAKIEAVTGEEALAASGGLCAPVTPYYDLMMVSEAMRPVRDNLPVFNAARGGIRFMAPPSLAAVTTAVGRITAAQDGLGGTNATKTCQTVACPSQTEVDVAIIFHCLRFGNLGSRAWPEQIEQFTGLTEAAFARVAEVALLDGMSAGSTAVTGAQVGGAVNTLLGQIITAAAGQRSRHRMAPERVLRAALPAWSLDLLTVDLARQQFGRFDTKDVDVISFLRAEGIEPWFYQDGPTGASQIFGAQGAGALLGFPPTCVWFLYPEGSFIYLDGGTLELGIVRDSTLNSTNDYQIFGEGFENIAFIGVESLKITSTVCATGEVTLPRTLSCSVGP